MIRNKIAPHRSASRPSVWFWRPAFYRKLLYFRFVVITTFRVYILVLSVARPKALVPFFSLSFFLFSSSPLIFIVRAPSFLRVLTLILIMETHIDARESFYIILRNATKRYCSNKLYRSSLGKAKITEKLNPFDKSSFRHSSTPPSNSIEFN